MTYPLGGNPLPVWIQGSENEADNALRSRPFGYTTVRTGELVALATAKQCPSIACDMVRFRAHPDNGGNIHIGWNAGVTVTNGVDDTSTGLLLSPGDDSGWIPVANLNLLFYIGSIASLKMTYILVSP